MLDKSKGLPSTYFNLGNVFIDTLLMLDESSSSLSQEEKRTKENAKNKYANLNFEKNSVCFICFEILNVQKKALINFMNFCIL